MKPTGVPLGSGHPSCPGADEFARAGPSYALTTATSARAKRPLNQTLARCTTVGAAFSSLPYNRSVEFRRSGRAGRARPRQRTTLELDSATKVATSPTGEHICALSRRAPSWPEGERADTTASCEAARILRLDRVNAVMPAPATAIGSMLTTLMLRRVRRRRTAVRNARGAVPRSASTANVRRFGPQERGRFLYSGRRTTMACRYPGCGLGTR